MSTLASATTTFPRVALHLPEITLTGDITYDRVAASSSSTIPRRAPRCSAST